MTRAGEQRTGGPAVRPRYGRIATLAVALLVTLVAMLGGSGVLPGSGEPSYAADGNSAAEDPEASGPDSDPEGAMSLAAEEPSPTQDPVSAVDPDETTLPPDSGEGRRVVFDMGAQRVWLVREDGAVARTYLVSGSRYDNLEPGPYEVYSRSLDAVGIDGSTMRHMVRFTAGANAAIGFHDIPYLEGERVQTKDQLGTPLSHGCIRQWPADARALWRFAPVGTSVVVVD